MLAPLWGEAGGWENLAYLAWRRGGMCKTCISLPIPVMRLWGRQSQALHSGKCTVGQETMAINWNKIAADRMEGITFSPGGQSSNGSPCTEGLYSFHLWSFSQPSRVKCWVTWSDLLADPALLQVVGLSDCILSNLNYCVILRWYHTLITFDALLERLYWHLKKGIPDYVVSSCYHFQIFVWNL